MNPLQTLLLVFLPAATAQADCGRLSTEDTYEKLNKILNCLESRIIDVQKEFERKLDNAALAASDKTKPAHSSATEPNCRIEENRLDASLLMIGTRCSAVGSNAVVNADVSGKVGITLADTSKPGTMSFNGFDPVPVTSIIISLKIQYIKEQTLAFWNGAQRVASLQITPHHLIFDGTKNTIKKTPFTFRRTNEIEVKLEGGNVRLYVNGSWVSDAETGAPGFDRITLNGLRERDYVYAISATVLSS